MQLNWPEKKKVSYKHTPFFWSLSLSVSSCSPLCCPYRKLLLTSRRLCFCLDLRIEFFRGPHHQIWNRNCSFISLEAGRWVVGANYLLPSLHYAACFPVSASQVLPPSPSPYTSVLFQVEHDTNILKHTHVTPCKHVHVDMRGKQTTWSGQQTSHY